jgi:repressor LexA
MNRISQLINQLLEEKDMTQTELSRLTGITQSSISDYITGKYKPKQDKIDLIARALGVSPAIFVSYPTDSEETKIKEDEADYLISKKLPVLGTIAAGIPLLADQNIEDHFIVDSRLNADYIIKIKGNSMIEEGILDGDFAFIKIQHQVENGEIAAVLIEDSATLKKVYRQNGTITLVSANKDIPPKVFTNGDIRIMGKLVAVLNVR